MFETQCGATGVEQRWNEADYEVNDLLKVGERDKENTSESSEQSEHETNPNHVNNQSSNGYWGERWG